MPPGLTVARIDTNKWAISSRGFNSRFSDKLLVLMDGRSAYNPLYSGVYLEVQDIIIEDIANADFDSQVVVAYESGYRFLASENLSFDIALFYYDYDDFGSFSFSPAFNSNYAEVYNKPANDADGTSHGLEPAGAWQVLGSLKLDLAYSCIKEAINPQRVSEKGLKMSSRLLQIAMLIHD